MGPGEMRDMTELKASRTLVKSPPELWAECSDASSLARHLDQFGEIRITRLEPETTVAWEGEEVSGTVRLEPAGWGTRVILTAQKASEAAENSMQGPEDPPQEPEPQPPPSPLPPAASDAPGRRRGLFGRLLSWLEGPPVSVSAESAAGRPPAAAEAVATAAGPEPVPAPEPEPEESSAELVAALDSLGQAHHRPFSRA